MENVVETVAFISVKQGIFRKYSPKELSVPWNNDDYMSLVTHNTVSGRCLTLHLKCPFQQLDSVIILLNTTGNKVGSSLPVFFHHTWDHVGLNDNYWKGQVAGSFASFNQVSDVRISLQMRKRRNIGSVEMFYECLARGLESSAKQILVEKKLCYFPSFQSVFKAANVLQKNLSSCTSYEQFIQTRKAISFILASYLRLECETPGEELVFKADKKLQASVVNEGMSVVNVYPETQEVVLEKEYVLLDLPALVAAIGGFVGMLLGWSAKDLAAIVADLMDRSF